RGRPPFPRGMSGASPTCCGGGGQPMFRRMARSDEARCRRLARRWLPGILSLFFGALAAFAVLCFHYPAVLTTPELRAVYPMPLVRAALASGIAAAVVLGALAL